MNINITGRHLDITPSIRQYIEEKVAKVEKSFHPVLDAHVIISVDKYRHAVEIILKTNSSVVRVKGESEDMYASIDLTTDKLNSCLRKMKEKLKDHKHHREPTIDELVPIEEVLDEFEAEHMPGVFLKRIEVKPMDVDEAQMQLDLLGYAFLTFRRVDTDDINVIYKTKLGDYIVLEPVHS